MPQKSFEIRFVCAEKSIKIQFLTSAVLRSRICMTLLAKQLQNRKSKTCIQHNATAMQYIGCQYFQRFSSFLASRLKRKQGTKYITRTAK